VTCGVKEYQRDWRFDFTNEFGIRFNGTGIGRGRWGRTELGIVLGSIPSKLQNLDILLDMVFPIEIRCESGDCGDGCYGCCCHVALKAYSLSTFSSLYSCVEQLSDSVSPRNYCDKLKCHFEQCGSHGNIGSTGFCLYEGSSVSDVTNSNSR
jgi:hypothetical protein